MVSGLWFMVSGFSFPMCGSGFRAHGLWFRVLGLGLQVPVDASKIDPVVLQDTPHLAGLITDRLIFLCPTARWASSVGCQVSGLICLTSRVAACMQYSAFGIRGSWFGVRGPWFVVRDSGFQGPCLGTGPLTCALHCL
jgi:hypothetical protein